ncbi:hypothetical protein [uncultured Fibrella sp.]
MTAYLAKRTARRPSGRPYCREGIVTPDEWEWAGSRSRYVPGRWC